MQACPCQNDHLYKVCCYPFHIGERQPQNPLELMKSRYSAYAMKLSDYIMDTTHPKNPQYETDRAHWKAQIDQFCYQTIFLNLEILSYSHNHYEGYVTFRASLEQKGQDVSFEEKSHFVYENSQWMYLNGQVKSLAR